MSRQSTDAVHAHVPATSDARVRVALRDGSSVIDTLTLDVVKQRQMPLYIEATGQLQANANSVTRISAPIAGKLLSVEACLGDTVSKGTTVATISSQELGVLVTDLFKQENDIDSDLSKELLQIDCDIKSLETDLALCKKQHNRATLLLEEKIGSQASVEASQAELTKHELNLEALKAKGERTSTIAEQKKKMARISLEQKLTLFGMPPESIKAILNGKSMISSIPIKTPQSGIVLERNINNGELVDPSTTLFVIDDIDNLWLVADIFEQDVDNVRVGQSIEFSVDSLPGKTFTGHLDYVAGTISPETRTLPVRAVIPNPGFKLKPKMFARMHIHVGNRQVLTIPKEAIQDAGSQTVVYVPISKHTFEERIVSLGNHASDYVEVVKGLKSNEKIVVHESFALRSQSLKQTR